MEVRRLHVGVATHPGRRPVNEDAALAEAGVLAVADGVSSSPRGDLAARAAIAHLEIYEQAGRLSEGGGLVSVVEDLERTVELLGARWSALHGSATTLCLAVPTQGPDGQLWLDVAHVGDSRAYIIRDGHTHQLTVDHTLAEALRGAGLEATGRAEHVVTSVLDGQTETEITCHRYRLASEDAVVLVTDGVSGVVSPDGIASIVAEYSPDPQRIADALVHAAWENGASDNITAAVGLVTPDPSID